MPSSLTPPAACESCSRAAFLCPRGNRWLCANCSLTNPPKIAEILNRTKRVYALADLLNAHNITADEARRMTPEEWAAVAKAAGINPPSLETKLATVASLEAVGVAHA
jgi:hypothetical protein